MIALFLAMLSGNLTPHAATVAFLHPAATHSHPTTKIVAQSDKYALVYFANGIIESRLSTGYVLTKKFSFGWQPIDLSANGALLDVCTARSHGIAGADLKALRRKLSPASNARCRERQRDLGPQIDVEAVRAQMPSAGEIIPFVRVVDGYAMGEWWGNGGGENFYKRTVHGWKAFAGGGGAIRPGDLHQHYNVPLAVDYALLK